MTDAGPVADRRPRALVTGSAGGIGQAVAVALHAAGYDVVGVDLLPHSGPEFAQTLTADLSDAEQCLAVTDAAGPVDVLVNNAAILHRQAIAELTPADIDRTFAINLRAPVLLTQGVLPAMCERGFGRVVFLASIAARSGGQPRSSMYGITKAGIVAFTKNVARNYAPFGITANAIAPGGVVSGMTSDLDAAQLEEMRLQIPVGRLADPSEIAAAICFLVSPGAGHITGVTLDINGGWLMV